MELQYALIEGLKELARVMLIAVIPLVIVGLETGRVDWQVIGIAAIIAGLKLVDKVLHKSDLPIKGLLPF